MLEALRHDRHGVAVIGVDLAGTLNAFINFFNASATDYGICSMTGGKEDAETCLMETIDMN